MKTHTLHADERTIAGKKVKNLRKQGLIPATVYGKTVKSTSVSVAHDAFEKVFAEAGETGLIELDVNKHKKPVLVHNIHVHPVSGDILHIEFHQVDLKEKVKAKVPVEITGESPAIAQKLGVLLTVLDEIEVEALPTDLPEKILIDVSGLEAVNDEKKVADITVSKDVIVLTDKDLTIVKVGPLVTKEAEKQAQAEEAAAAEAAAAAAPAEGATPAATTEGAAPAGDAAAKAPPAGGKPAEEK